LPVSGPGRSCDIWEKREPGESLKKKKKKGAKGEKDEKTAGIDSKKAFCKKTKGTEIAEGDTTG